MDFKNIKVAYFSAEIAIKDGMKTYAGGLGVLAGGILKSTADLGYEMCGVTLLYKKGFFKQIIDNKNEQEELSDYWDYKSYLIDLNKKVKVNIDGRDVYIKIWVYEHKGIKGVVPVFFLDTDVEENNVNDRSITAQLYVGDRLKQEIVLGIGGFRALEALGIEPKKYHMNEGHSSFLTLMIYKKFGKLEGYSDDVVKKRAVFTTHTPIPAGHDKFPYDLFYKMLRGEEPDIIPWHLKTLAGNDILNTTRLAMSLSGYINAVSKKHQEVTKKMFPEFADRIDYITNGIHVPTWISQPFDNLYNKYLGDWKLKPEVFLKADSIPNNELINAKESLKSKLIDYVNKNSVTEVNFKKDILTIVFARRFISYKNAEMIFEDLERLKSFGDKIQIVFAGKSHMKDTFSKKIITRILEYSYILRDYIQIAFLKDYSKPIAKILVHGSDIWLNTPIPPNEASGTSGMKATVNAGIHFSTLDGWALESFEKGFGGYPISNSKSLYDLLEYKIIPMFYNNKDEWISEMKASIVNGSYFNNMRALKDYIAKAYEKK